MNVTIRKQPTPAARPMSIAGNGVTNPDAGVMATRPATAPEIAPSALGRPRVIHSAASQPIVAVAAAKYVATNALAASPFDASALPALKPNQPTHRRHAPMKLRTRLCGGIGSLG